MSTCDIPSFRRLALRIVAVVAPQRWRTSIQGDLEEEWNCRRVSPGRARTLWTALEISARLLPVRFRPDPGGSPKGSGRERAAGLAVIRQDLAYAVRMLCKHPVSAAAAVLTLALGIGANTAIFAVVDKVLLEPLPFPDEDRVVVIRSLNDSGNLNGLPSYLTETLRAGADSLASVSTYRLQQLEISGPIEPALSVTVVGGQTPLLEVLGVPPALGGVGDPDAPYLVATHAFFENHLSGEADLLGRLLHVGDEAHPLLAVLPPGVHFPDLDVQLLLLSPPPAGGVRLPGGGSRVSLLRDVVARLQPGVALPAAAAEAQGLADTLTEVAGLDRPLRVRLVPLRESMVGDVRPALIALLVSLGLVLLIAAANVAHMILARLRSRSRELALRTVLGAGRRRLFGQLATESLLTATLGGTVGILLAAWGLSLLVAARPDDLPRPDAIGLGLSAWTVAAALTLLTGVAFAALSALSLDSRRLWADLKQGEQLSAGRAENRLGKGLLVGEVASATLLLICAGLTLNSFVRLTQVDTGYEPEGLLTAQLPRFPSTTEIVDGREVRRRPSVRPFVEELTARLESDPRVVATGLATIPPFARLRSRADLVIPGRTGPDERTTTNVATPGYFTTIGARLLEGDLFSEQDSPETEPVVIVNETFRRRYFPDESPVGHRIQVGRDVNTIVGVVADIKRGTFDEVSEPEVFESLLQHERRYWGIASLVLRIRGEPDEFMADLRSLALSVDARAQLPFVQTVEARLYDSVARPRFYAFLGLILSGVATTLVAVGLYGLVALAAARSQRAIAIRMALGARPSDVVRESVREWMVLVAAGGLLGVAGGLLASRSLMTVELFRVSSTDPWTYGLVVGLLLAVALVASWIPARRAARLDPLEALRAE